MAGALTTDTSGDASISSSRRERPRLLWSKSCRQTEIEAHYKDVTENGTSARLRNEPKGNGVPKDKKKKDKKDKTKGKNGPSKAAKRLKTLAENPLVADVVAAAL